MDGLPVTIRLLDPPLHEFLPDLTELSVRVARRRGARRGRRGATLRLLAAVRAHARGRTRCSACAACGSAWSSRACSPCRCGRSPRPRRERAQGRRRPAAGDHGPAGRRGAGAGAGRATRPSGCSPRSPSAGRRRRRPDRHDDRAAAGGADRRPDRRGGRVLLLRHQRPDPDDLGLLPRRRRGARSSPRYLELGIFGVSPFESLDRDGVGRLVRIARRARAARPGPDLKLGVCGEHGGDPESVHFFHEVGLDYVSCSPFRVPVARLEAGRAAVGGSRLRRRGERAGPVRRRVYRDCSDPSGPCGWVVGGSAVVDSRDPARLARWWAEVLGYRVTFEKPDLVAIAGTDEPIPASLRAGAEAKAGKNRLHLDLEPDDQPAEIERLVDMGARHVDIGQPRRRLDVADPEGNEFCRCCAAVALPPTVGRRAAGRGRRLRSRTAQCGRPRRTR